VKESGGNSRRAGRGQTLRGLGMKGRNWGLTMMQWGWSKEVMQFEYYKGFSEETRNWK
jgi:hypothetical protein